MHSNRRSRYLFLAFALLLSVSLLVPLIGGIAPSSVRAQDDTMTCSERYLAEHEGYTEMDGPRPASSEGDATWTIDERTFQSNYPDGMTFTIEAESNAGEITNTRVIWEHSPGSGNQRSIGATFDPDTGWWVGDFNAARTRNVPPWVLVRYRWEFTDEAGNSYVTEELDELYEDVERADEWGHAESEDVVVHWLGLTDDVGQLVIDAMAARREFYCEAWGGLLPYRPRAVLYDWSELEAYEVVLGRQAQVGSGITAGTTGSDWGGTVQLQISRFTNVSTAYGTVLHEVAHLYQNMFTVLGVDWFAEGNAEFFSVARDGNYRNYAYQRLLTDDPLSFANGFEIRGQNSRDGYEIGTTVFDYLVETYGLDAHRRLWETIKQGHTRFEAIEIVTGVSIQQFETDWRAWLGITSAIPTVVPTPTPLIDLFSMPTPTFSSPPG